MTFESFILDNLKKLPESMQQAVLLYTEFLVEQITQQRASQSEAKPETSSGQRGGLGIWKGKVWIADDFDAPLDDFQEYI